jgi:tol-pal system protein YbgF
MVLVRGVVMAALLVPLLAGCVSTAEFRRLERDVQTMQKKDTKSGREQVASVSTQIDDLSDQIKKLQGRVEVVENQTQKAMQEARAARKEAGARASGPAMGEPLLLSSAEPPPAGGPPAMTPVPSEPRPTAALPRLAEPPPPAVQPAFEPPLGAGDEKSASADEVQSYRNAYAAWRSGDSEACIDQFRKFLQTHPASPYADDAAYWMADCYFKRGEYRTAILRFDDVVKRYPKGNKAADALYRQGEALMKSGPAYAKAARQAFEQVLSDFPDSPRAADAKKQIEQLGGTAASVAAPKR